MLEEGREIKAEILPELHPTQQKQENLCWYAESSPARSSRVKTVPTPTRCPRLGLYYHSVLGRRGNGLKEDVTSSHQGDRELYFGNKHLDFAEA